MASIEYWFVDMWVCDVTNWHWIEIVSNVQESIFETLSGIGIDTKDMNGVNFNKEDTKDI
jgi:hypothetical protein